MEPALMALAKLDEPKSVKEISVGLNLDDEQILGFAQRLFEFGYLTVAEWASEEP